MATSSRSAAAIGRRRFFGLAGGAAAGLALTACGTSAVADKSSSSPTGTPVAGSSGSAAAGPAGGTLTVWANAALTADKTTGLGKAAAAFGTLRGVTVNVQGIPTQDLTSKLTTTVGGGAGPDVCIVDSSAVPQLAAGKVLADISSQSSSIAGQFVPDTLKYSTYQSKQFGIPYYSNDVVLFLNKDLMGKAVEMTDGSTAVVDEAYLRESILNSQARVVKGFQPLMPTFQGLISEEGLAALIEHIKSLSPQSSAAAPALMPASAPTGSTPAAPAQGAGR